MKIIFVKKLNNPYSRLDFVIGGICKILDGIVDIISFGYFRTGFHMWWVRKTTHKALTYISK